MRKGDEMYGVEGRGPVGRPRKTWLESVKAEMAEHEIDKEDVHDRNKSFIINFFYSSIISNERFN